MNQINDSNNNNNNKNNNSNNNNKINIKSIKEKINKNILSYFYFNKVKEENKEIKLDSVDIVVQIENIQNDSIIVNDSVYRYKLYFIDSIPIRKRFILYSVIKLNGVSIRNLRLVLDSFTTLYHLDQLLSNNIIDHPGSNYNHIIYNEIGPSSFNNNSSSGSIGSGSSGSLQKRKARYQDITFGNKKNKLNNNNNDNSKLNNNINNSYNSKYNQSFDSFYQKESITNNLAFHIDQLLNKRIQKYILYNYYQLHQTLNNIPSDNSTSSTSSSSSTLVIELYHCFLKLTEYFIHVDPQLSNQKISKYLNNIKNTNNSNSNNNSNNSNNNISNNSNQKSLYKLLSIYILSILNHYCESDQKESEIKEIYANVIFKIGSYNSNNNNNNNSFEEYIYKFYNRIYIKSKYQSINNKIKYLKYIRYQVELIKRRDNISLYQLSNISKDSLPTNVQSKNKEVLFKYIESLKCNNNNNNNNNSSSSNNNNNNIYNSNEIIKVYDQEVYQYKFFLKPELYCNKQVFQSQCGMNPDELSYNITNFQGNIFHETPSVGNYSISPSLELFKLCFDVFSNGLFRDFNWGNYNDDQQNSTSASSQNNNNTKVIVSGGSITACIDSLPKAIKKEFINYKRIERLLYKTKMPIILTKKLMQDIFDSSFLKNYLYTRVFDTISPYFDSDIDVWIISNDLDSARSRLYQVIDQIVGKCKSINPIFDSNHIFVRTENAVTLIQPYPYRKIQFIIKVYSTVDQLLSSFDIDCVRLFYDGSNVFIHKSSIDSFNKRYSISKFNKVGRVVKYSVRGFKIFPFDDKENSSYNQSCVDRYLKEYRTFYDNYNSEAQYYKYSNSSPPLVHNDDFFMADCDSNQVYQKYSKDWNFENILKHLQKLWSNSSSYILSISTDPVFLIETDSPSLCRFNIKDPTSPPMLLNDYFSTNAPSNCIRSVSSKVLSSTPLSNKIIKIANYELKFETKCKYCDSVYSWVNREYCCNTLRLDGYDTILYQSEFRSLISEFKNVLVLGGRNSIGYRIAAKLLNYGFNVFITTRFPHITKELIVSKFHSYKFNLDRLHIIKVDFNDLVQHSKFIQYIKSTIPSLDIIINTIHLSNKHLNQDYQLHYNQLLNKELNLINSNSSSSSSSSSSSGINNESESINWYNKHGEIKIIDFTNNKLSTTTYSSEKQQQQQEEEEEYSIPVESSQSLVKIEPTKSNQNNNTLINNSLILHQEFINYINYQLPNNIIDQLKSILKFNLNYSNTEEAKLRHSLNIHDHTSTSNKEKELIDEQELFSLQYDEYASKPRGFHQLKGIFIGTTIIFDINSSQDKDLKQLALQFNYQKVSYGLSGVDQDKTLIKDHIIYFGLNNNNNNNHNHSNNHHHYNSLEHKFNSNGYTLKRNLNNITIKPATLSSKELSNKIIKHIIYNYLSYTR